jgi:5'-nucleotidase
MGIILMLYAFEDFDMTMSRHWVRNKETDALERNSSSHGIPARSDIMSLEVKQCSIYSIYTYIQIIDFTIV